MLKRFLYFILHYTEGIFLALVSLRLSSPQGHKEGLDKFKIPITSSGIEPTASGF
jgi:hypothetical protein